MPQNREPTSSENEPHGSQKGDRKSQQKKQYTNPLRHPSGCPVRPGGGYPLQKRPKIEGETMKNGRNPYRKFCNLRAFLPRFLCASGLETGYRVQTSIPKTTNTDRKLDNSRAFLPCFLFPRGLDTGSRVQQKNMPNTKEHRPEIRKCSGISPLVFCYQAGWRPAAEYKKACRTQQNTDRELEDSRVYLP